MFKQGHLDTTWLVDAVPRRRPRQPRRDIASAGRAAHLPNVAAHLPKVAARLPKAPHPENVSRSTPPYGYTQYPAVCWSSSVRERPETPSSVHRSPVGSRIDYKRPFSPCLAH
jgi:hypothetical protein